MTLTIFQDWLKDLNSKMPAKERKYLLLLDNAPIHPKRIKQYRINFSPTNTSSLIQPLDQGIIKSFKDYYKKSLSMSLNFNLDINATQETWCKKIDLYQSMVWTNVKLDTICNCFTKSFENSCFKQVIMEHDNLPCIE